MATIKLYPDTTDGSPGAGDWAASSGDRHDAIDGDDATKIAEGTNSTTITFTVDNILFAALNVDTITNVQHSVHAYSNGRPPNTISIKVEMLDGDDSDTSLYEDTHIVTTNGGSSAEYTGTSRATWDGSDAWTQTKLSALKMKFTLVDNDVDGDGNPFPGNITWAYFTVTYTEIAAAVIPKSLTINGVATINGQLTIK